MDPKHLFIDERLTRQCIYCGGFPETVEHVPSRILLDNPLPENLPVVDACRECNTSFSLDEEYLACLLECVAAGTTEPTELSREKIKKSIARNGRLKSNLEQCRRIDGNGNIWWQPDEKRVKRIIVKLARGHTAYELGELLDEEPDFFSMRAIPTMSEAELQNFETPNDDYQLIWPEIGSRAFLRATGKSIPPKKEGHWFVVQRNRYRYWIDWQNGVEVRMMIGEYLACQIIWQ